MDLLDHVAMVGSHRMFAIVDRTLPAVQRLADDGKTDQASNLAEGAIGVLLVLCDGSVRQLQQLAEQLAGILIGLNQPADAKRLLAYADELASALQGQQQILIGLLLPYIEQDNLLAQS